MKSSIRIFIFFVCSILSMPSFAYISGKKLVTEKLIYCPEQIICKSSDISSCSFISESSQYWVSLNPSFRVEKNTYKFEKVTSGYHGGDSPSCFYKTLDSSSSLFLNAKHEANLEAYFSNTTKWEKINNSIELSCKSDSPNSCPLKERSGIRVISSIKDLNSGHLHDKGLMFTANNVAINYSSSGGDIFIEYEAADSCWSDQQCKIDIDLQSNVYGHIFLGSIIVDMDNRMKILNVIPAPSSEVTINKVDPFNTLEIKNQDIYSVLEVSSLIKQPISISVNNTLITTGASKVYSYLVENVCPNISECKLDLKIKQGLIGSVVVDVKHNMNVLSVSSIRASEISIRKVSARKVEVGYPNLH